VSSVQILRGCICAHIVGCSQVPDRSLGQLACAAEVSWTLPCQRPPRNLDIVLGYDHHHELLPAPRYLYLFQYSLALSAFWVVACLGGGDG